MKDVTKYLWIGLFLVFLVVVGCREGSDNTDPGPIGSEFEFGYDFETDMEGWAVGFADLPVADTYQYQLASSHQELPSDLEGYGIYIQGDNQSDDLFMFFKKQVSGLKPDTAYQVTFEVEMATNVPEGMVGAGGSPGESVYVKAGATAIEPFADEDDAGYYRMNIDKGNQATEGEDAINLGNIANPQVEADEYKIKVLANTDRPFLATSDSEGRLWVLVGTDSGFEGLTAVYYDHILITLTEAETGQST